MGLEIPISPILVLTVRRRSFGLTGASTYTGCFALFTNQRLIGQGVVDTGFDTALGITPPATSVARPAINGTRPTINGTINLATADHGGTGFGTIAECPMP